jgi:hypothetical protein
MEITSRHSGQETAGNHFQCNDFSRLVGRERYIGPVLPIKNLSEEIVEPVREASSRGPTYIEKEFQRLPHDF